MYRITANEKPSQLKTTVTATVYVYVQHHGVMVEVMGRKISFSINKFNTKICISAVQ